MSAYSTLYISREKALAALMAVRFNPTNEMLSEILTGILNEQLYEVRVQEAWMEPGDDNHPAITGLVEQ